MWCKPILVNLRLIQNQIINSTLLISVPMYWPLHKNYKKIIKILHAGGFCIKKGVYSLKESRT